MHTYTLYTHTTLGRLDSLDAFIQSSTIYDTAFLTGLTQAIEQLTSQDPTSTPTTTPSGTPTTTATAPGGVTEYAKLYLQLANKIIEKGTIYINTEINRLDKMIKSSSVLPINKANFQLKQNILKAFIKDEN